MTTVERATVRCACCGNAQETYVTTSTNSFGPPDLDMRPAPDARYSFASGVLECFNCGYCAPDLAIFGPAASATMKSDEYRRFSFRDGVGRWRPPEHDAERSATSKSRRNDPLAALSYAKFRRWALIAHAQGNSVAAADALLGSAWIADDAHWVDEARTCRPARCRPV